jgi:hypothetical protein
MLTLDLSVYMWLYYNLGFVNFNVFNSDFLYYPIFGTDIYTFFEIAN